MHNYTELEKYKSETKSEFSKNQKKKKKWKDMIEI